MHGCRKGAGTDANVSVTLVDTKGQKFGPRVLNATPAAFERGCNDVFKLQPDRGLQLGVLEMLIVEHDNSGPNPDWLLSKVTVKRAGESDIVFVCEDWLAHPKLQRSLQRCMFAQSSYSAEKKTYKVSVYTGQSHSATISFISLRLWEPCQQAANDNAVQVMSRQQEPMQMSRSDSWDPMIVLQTHNGTRLSLAERLLNEGELTTL